MANNKDENKDENLNFELDEFFPLDGNLDKSENPNSPTFVSYTKNLLKTAKFALGTMAEATLPNAVKLVTELGIAKDTAVDAAKEEIDKISDYINKKKRDSNGKSIKETIAGYKDDLIKGVKEAARTGDFTFGSGDVDLSMFNDTSFISDVDETTGSSKSSNKTDAKKAVSSEEIFAEQSNINSAKNAKIAIALEKSSQTQNFKLYSASMSVENARHLQSIGYLSSIDSNVSKITKYLATVGSKGIAAQFEYSEKNLALQQDSVKLLNTIREQTYTPPSTENKIGGDSVLSSIFGNGLSGSAWMEHIISNIKETAANSPLGLLTSALGMADQMGVSKGLDPKKEGITRLFKMIPNLLLNQETKMKLGNFNQFIPSIPSLLNAKFNQLALTSDNPLLRGIGSYLGVKELSSKKIDLGVKDLDKKALFDKKFYTTVTTIIPSLLSKMLASQTGTGEIVYDFTTGNFKTGEQAIREYKYERTKAYESSLVYNEMGDKLLKAGNKGLQEELEQGKITKEEYDKKSEILAKDFKTIRENIANTSALFDPKKSLKNETYQKLISQGVIDRNNFLYFVEIFSKNLNEDDKLFFAQGSQEVRRNIEDFYHRRAPEMIKTSAGGNIIADELTNEKMAEAERILKFKDISRFHDTANPIQVAAKRRYMEGMEEIKMKFGGRAGTIKSTDISDIGEVSKKGVINTQLGVLNNIYELLLGGILVYPRNNAPSELLDKMKDYNLLKDNALIEKENEEALKKLNDEQMAKTRREQYSLGYRSTEAMKSLPRIMMERLFGPQMNVIDDLQDRFNKKVVDSIEKGKSKLFDITYGKNEEKNNNLPGFEEQMIESVKSMSTDISENLGDFFGRRKQKQHTTSSLVEETSKEKPKLDETASLKDKAVNEVKYLFSKLFGGWGEGSIDFEKLKEMISDRALGPIDESLVPVKPSVKKLTIPEETGLVVMSSPKTEESVQKLPEFSNKIDSLLSTINENISKTTDVLSTIKDNTVKPYDDKKDITSNIPSSGSIVSSIDAMHNTNKEFFKSVLDSGVFNIIKSISESNDSIKTSNDSMASSLELILAKLLGSENRDSDIDPKTLNLLRSKHGTRGLFGRMLLISKRGMKFGIHRVGDITKGITGAFKALLPGIGKGIGGLASGYGKMFSALVGAGVGTAKFAGRTAVGLTKGVYNKIFKRGKGSSEEDETITDPETGKTSTKPKSGKKKQGLIGKSLSAVGSVVKGVGKGIGFGAKGAGSGTGMVLKGLGAAAGGILGGVGSLAKHLLGFDDGKVKTADVPDIEDLKSRNMSTKDILLEMLIDVKAIRHHVATSRGGIVSNILGTISGMIGNAVKLPGKMLKKKKKKGIVQDTEEEDLKEFEDTESSTEQQPKSIKNKLLEKGKKIAGSIRSKVKEKVKKGQKKILNYLEAKNKELDDKAERVANLKNKANELSSSAKGKIKGIINTSVEKSKGLISDLDNKISESEKLSSARDAVKNTIDSAKRKISKSKKVKSVKKVTKDIGNTVKDIGDKTKEIGSSVIQNTGEFISNIKEKVSKKPMVAATKASPKKESPVKQSTTATASFREGSLLDQRKDKRDELMLRAEISMDKNITKILKLLKSNLEGPFKKRKKDSDKDDKKEGLLGSIGSGAVGLAAGAALLGTGAYQSIFGKSRLNKKTGIDEYGNTGDKMMSNLSLDASSKYGFSGEELTFAERSAQSASLTHAPQALLTAKAMYKGTKKIGGLVPKAAKFVAKAVVPKVVKSAIKARIPKVGLDIAAKTTAIAKNIPKSILGIFDKLFSAGPVKKLVSTKMANTIKGTLGGILKPGLFKGIGSKIAKKIASLIGPIGIGMTINDFITGMDSTSRYFSLGKGARPSLSMRIISGVVNVLSSFLFGLIPADFIVKTLYSVIGSSEDKEYIQGFNKFTQEKAGILDVPAGPLGEYETKNFWQKAFGSEKRDAGTLKFGADPKGIEKYKKWRDDKYKPVEELRQKVSNQYGGDGVVGAIPSTETEKANQKAYREKFLGLASDLVKTIEARSETVSKEMEDKSSEVSKDKTEPENKTGEKFQSPTPQEPKTPSIMATAAGITATGAMATSGSEKTDVSIPEDVNNTSEQMKSAISDANKINNSVGLPPISNVDIASGAVATAGISGIKMQEPAKVNKDDFKITPSNEEEKKSIGSPVVDSYKNLTSEITTELDALKMINAEQSRHNVVSEEFYQNAVRLLTLLVETGKSSFDLDKSRNEILAKNLLVDIDPKYKKYMKNNTDTSDMKDYDKDKNTDKKDGGFMNSVFGKKTETERNSSPINQKTSQIMLGPNSQFNDSSSESKPLSDKGEKSYKPSEVDLSSYVDNMFSFDDDKSKNEKQADNLTSMISDYKKENPISNKVMQNYTNNKTTSNYIQDIVSGVSGTHEIYETNVPVVYKNKRIGLKNIYIPKINTSGVRAGDVIIETKFVNGDKQYSVDNSGETAMSVKVDYSKGKFGKGANSVVLNMNIPDNVANKNPSLTSKLIEIVSNGGRQ